MPEAVLTPQEWEAVKLANVQGVSDTELSERFGVSTEAIRQRRFRDPVWKAAFEASKGSYNVVSQKAPETLQIAQKVASSVSESISALGERNRLLALQIAAKGLKQADQAPPEVQSWQDVKALMDIVSKASGMESGNAVQVNVLSSGPLDFSPAFEA